jgi:hypothetical protein
MNARSCGYNVVMRSSASVLANHESLIKRSSLILVRVGGLLLGLNFAYHLSRRTDGQAERRDVLGDYTSSANDGIMSNLHTGSNWRLEVSASVIGDAGV